ncbi:MAG: zinc ribbon domain-containing protein [Candidatus Bathyarchaeia archaeon]|jgi:type II secretory pathway pseudopilin PulG
MASAAEGFTNILVPVVLILAAGLALGLPWYPVVTEATVTQTLTYTYNLPTQTYQNGQPVWTLGSPVTLQGWFQSGATFERVFKDLDDVSLTADWTVNVHVTQCQFCITSVAEDFGNKETVYALTGTGTGSFIVPKSGPYKISVTNFGNTEDQVTAISMTADEPQNVIEPMTGSNIVTYTTYAVVTQTPIYMLLPSFANTPVPYILLIVVLLVLFVMVYLAQKRTRKQEVTAESAKVEQTAIATQTEPVTTIEPTPKVEAFTPEPERQVTEIKEAEPTESIPEPSKTTMFCTECGASIPRDSKFCEECGANTS